MKDNFLDGINLDIELYCPPGSLLQTALLALRQELPWMPTSPDFCLPGMFPICPTTYQHYYNYAGMAQYSDFFFVMDYDEKHWYGTYVNSPYSQTVLGV